MRKTTLSILFAATLVIGACDKRGTSDIYPPGVGDNVLTIAQNQGLGVFVQAVTKAEMAADFDKLGQYTFLVPNDAAFAAAGIDAAALNALPPATLRSILRYHIISGRVISLDLLPGPNSVYTTIGRDSIFTSTYGSNVYFNGKKVASANILANNGIIHVIDGVLLPPAGNFMTTIASDPNLTFLAAAVTRANLATTLNAASPRLTIFAPTNAAFQAAGFADIAAINAADPAVLSNIIRYHAVPRRIYAVDVAAGNLPTLQGGTIAVISGNAIKGTSNTSNATLTPRDLQYRNGIIHTINQVLLP